MDNQYLLGGSHECPDEERLAILPLLLHPAPRDIAFIGLATGITPGAALLDPDLNSITVVELSPLVARAAAKFFGEFNHDLARDKRAKMVVDDGRTLIAAAPGRFDAIVGDLFLPWSPGEGRLYSVEHFRDVRRSLRAGGVFCQWLAMYQFTPRQLEIVADTFRSVFPHTFLFCNAMDSEVPTLALVGFQDDRELSWQSLETRRLTFQQRGLVHDAFLQSPESIAQLYLGAWRGPAQQGAPPALNTLGNLLIELDAGRERITGNPGAKYFFGDRWLRFCHDQRSEILAQGLPANSPLTIALLEQADDRMREDFLRLGNSQPASRPATATGPSETDKTKH